jgi:hypothetical protein
MLKCKEKEGPGGERGERAVGRDISGSKKTLHCYFALKNFEILKF